jgi:hypothetical protein
MSGNAIAEKSAEFNAPATPVIKRKPVYRSGELAKVFGVAPKTICNWIDKGLLKGFRLPGSKDRRLSHEELAKFIGSNPSYGYVLYRIEPDVTLDAKPAAAQEGGESDG